MKPSVGSLEVSQSSEHNFSGVFTALTPTAARLAETLIWKSSTSFHSVAAPSVQSLSNWRVIVFKVEELQYTKTFMSLNCNYLCKVGFYALNSKRG